jgi:urea transport system permease protein
VVPSIEMVIWVAVGGRGTLIGAILGAFLVNYGKSYFSESYPGIWQYFLGMLFVGSVLLFPQGIAGLFQQSPSWVRMNLARMRRSQSPRPISEATISSATSRLEGGS